MSHFTLGVVNVGGGECRGGECRTILGWQLLLIKFIHNVENLQYEMIFIYKAFFIEI